MSALIPVLIPQDKQQRRKLKGSNFVEDNNDDIAYFNFRLSIPSYVVAFFSLLYLICAIVWAYYFDIERLENGYNSDTWMNVGDWVNRTCNITLDDIPQQWLPSVLRLFELNVVGNALFRVIVIVPIALRLFNSYIIHATNSLQLLNNNPLYRFCNNVAPYLLFLELSSCALFSIITIRHDFPEIHRNMLLVFVLSSALHMLAVMGTSFWKSRDDQEQADRISGVLKVCSFIGFSFAAPQFLSYHQTFIDFPDCHPYVPPFEALCEYIMFTCYAAFHLTSLIDNRYARFVCYPRTASGECEPLKVRNFQAGGRYEHCRSWELAQRRAQHSKEYTLNNNKTSC